MSRMTLVLLLLAPGLAWAGPGFEGVGDRGPVPRFEGAPRPPPPPHAMHLPPGILQGVLEHEEEILEVLKEHEPERHQRLVELREVDRQAYLLQLVHVGRQIQRLRDDPEARERVERIRTLDHDLREAASGYAALTPAEQRARRQEMVGLTEELFELKQAERRSRLEEMRSRIEQLEAEIEERERERKALVQDFVDQLLRGPVDL